MGDPFPGRSLSRLGLLGLACAWIDATSVLAQSIWTNTSGGYWEEPWWDRGLPQSGWSAAITNEGSKTVVFGPSTYLAYSNSISGLGAIIVSAPTGYTNRLLFEPAATPTTLQTYSGLWIGANGVAENRGADILTYPFAGNLVGAGGLYLQTSGSFDGASNSIVVNGGTTIAGGSVTVGSLSVRLGEWDQSGGAVAADAVSCSLGGIYELCGGHLNANAIQVGWEGVGFFVQSGGSLIASNIVIPGDGKYSAAVGGTYQLSGGVAQVGDFIFYHYHAPSYSQSGGLLQVTNRFLGVGGYTWGPGEAPLIAHGSLTGGTLSTPSENLGYTDFTQTGGTNSVSGSFNLCGASISWNWVTYQYEVIGSVYSLAGGSLVASNIGISSGTALECSAGDGGNHIRNDGKVWLAGRLSVLDHMEKLGPLILSEGNGNPFYGYAQLRLGSSGVLRFADSSGEAWSANSSLLIPDWNGSLSGGGASQVMFGTNNAGLARQQVSKIFFTNPHGLAQGTYPARVLVSGEAVPDGRVLFTSVGAAGLVLTWSGPYVLETSVDVAGPYVRVQGAASPYVMSFSPTPTEPKRFFRLAY
jgi:hypothetical protein